MIKLEIEKIVNIEAFKSIWFTWNNEENHPEAEDVYDEYQAEINYEIDKLFHRIYDKKNNEQTRQLLIQMKSKLRTL